MVISTIKKLPQSGIHVTAEIQSTLFESYRTKALKHLGESVEIPGFRKGFAPENIITKHLGEMTVLEQMADFAINDAYPKIITEHKFDPIGHPKITITKIAKGNPLTFTLETATIPEIILPDYKKIATNVPRPEGIEVTEKDADDVIAEFLKSRAEKVEGEKEPKIPELTDDFVKTLGEFSDVIQFKEKIKENVRLEKIRTTEEKRRIEILDALIAQSTIELTEIIIEEEIRRLLERLKHDLSGLNITLEGYLKNLKKTEDDLKKEWRPEAEKRGKLELILGEIALKEKVAPSEEELSSEIQKIMKDDGGKKLDQSRVRLYLTQAMTNQKVVTFLESLGHSF